MKFRVIGGEYQSVDQNTINNWKPRLSNIIERCDPVNIFNRDETGLL